MKLYVMLAFRRVAPAPNEVLVELFETLARRGHTLEIGIAEELIMSPQLLQPKHDLYLLKSHAPLWLSLAGILHAQGARLLNPFLGCRALQDKLLTARALREGGIPAPVSWVTGDLQRLQAIAAEHPLIIKPFDGRRAEGIRVVRNPLELAGVPEPERPVLVQQFVPNDGMDLKLYVVGSEVFGVRKPSPLLRERGPGERCAVNESVRKIALRCGELFNLSLYGVDLVEGPDGPVVVDVNYFPSYRTIPGAAALIADRIDLMLRTTGGTLNGRGRPQTDDGYGSAIWPAGEVSPRDAAPVDRGRAPLPAVVAQVSSGDVKPREKSRPVAVSRTLAGAPPSECPVP